MINMSANSSSALKFEAGDLFYSNQDHCHPGVTGIEGSSLSYLKFQTSSKLQHRRQINTLGR